jgi:hypothetical protein
MSAVTIITPSDPLCMRGVRYIIVEEDIDHPLIGRPVLDETSFVARKSRGTGGRYRGFDHER